MNVHLDHIENVFLIGIGGIGMSALARYWKHQGKCVAGYDIRETALTKKLVSESIPVFYSDDTNLIDPKFFTKKTLVVRTPAVSDYLNVLTIWNTYQIEVLRRSQMLALIASNHNVFAISGTHGKTTITTLLGHLLNQRTQKVNAFMGGIASNYASNLLLSSKTDDMVVEADEYDRAFLQLHPKAAVITSIDSDHLDIYGSFENIVTAFNQFARQINPNGLLIYKKGIAINIPANLKAYSYDVTDVEADIHTQNLEIIDGCYRFDLVTLNAIYPALQLGVPGWYNLENAVAASAMSIYAGITVEELKSGLKSFLGVERRFELHTTKPVIYIDDYAHHPNEINACIDSIRKIYPGKSILAIFQPHLYTRTRDFMEQFAMALAKADGIGITDIYPAREVPIEGINAQALIAKIPNAQYVDFESIASFAVTQDKDIILTMGAGSIGDKVAEIRKKLEDNV
ncbi:MAG: UDP-N-acetylmuramate--L-alanine ligase [Salinivirgaceae bacterium]|nr:UDP-N-acetylmuramate--L-alanine ligase [Salinivirgaceae bacterium]MDD4746646.1 UDP-N-acetylmuramate--L-alanine ligase [Salinivirgaceae bacterium]MDY0279767.1 UDP-N-acetylmuramate--L-alanine ligase [Salinivirgaceae bacterium]